MDYKSILYGILFFTIGQSVVWIQINGPLLWQWAKIWRFPLMLLGVPITWFFMEGTRHLVTASNGLFWPSRFMSFCVGIVIFTLFTWVFKEEYITTKTAVSLCLAILIMYIQLFW